MTWRAVFENPRSARQQLEALVWKHTHRDFRGKREDGTKVILVNTGAGPFRGQGSYGTESWPLSKLTDEQLCYQLPRSVREQHPELCGGGAMASNPSRVVEFEYSDPSAAHEKGLRLQAEGAYRVLITPKKGKYLLQAWFKTA